MEGNDEVTCRNGHPVGEGVKFCGVCGTPVVAAPTCPNGHEVTPGQSFCETCGAQVTEGSAGAEEVHPTRRKAWILIGGIVAVVVVAIGAAFLVVRARAIPEVSAENVSALLKDGGIECDDVNSVAAGQGTPEAELLQTTIVACIFKDASGEMDNTRTFGIFVADSPEALGKTIRVSGGCDGGDPEDDDLLVAYGPNWVAGGSLEMSQGAYVQEIATALGGEVTTNTDVVARFCELA